MIEVKLAQPRGYCAGVVRAIDVVRVALETFGAPVYVLHEIVHNQHVVAELQSAGARFVDALEEVPAGATLIFSAHGVSSATVEQAHRRDLQAIDATCPLVAKVHVEVARHARAGREVILIGHAGHPEVAGTLGRYDRRWGGEIYLVQRFEDIAALPVRRPSELAYVTQTTLSMDDASVIIAGLKARFPAIIGPARADICYATQNRQRAVASLAGEVDLLLVVGGRNSSNSNRLREVGADAGTPAYLIQTAADLDPRWLEGVTRVGVSAGASTPEILVNDLVARLRTLGAMAVVEMAAEPETIAFPLPEMIRAGHRPNGQEKG